MTVDSYRWLGEDSESWDHWDHDDSYACIYIKSLISGLPRQIRKRIHFSVLTQYIDDSGKEGPPVYVLAGWQTKAENWASFVDAWQVLLDKPPKLCYFKMEEAFSRREQFDGWSEKEADDRVIEFALLTDKFKLTPIESVISHSAFDQVLKQNRGPFQTPAYFALTGILIGLLQSMRDRAPTQREEMEFFFDEDTVKKGDLKRAYRLLMLLLARNGEHELRQLIPEEPIFRDDKKYLALQAADLYAWHVRRNQYEKSHGREWKAAAWNILRTSPLVLDCSFDRQLMQDIIAGMPIPGRWPRHLPRPPKKRRS